MSKLLFIPRPLYEESPTSLLKRLAVRHGCKYYSDLQGLLNDKSFIGSFISRSHPAIQSIATLGGVGREEFLSGFYEPIGWFTKNPPLKISGLVVNADLIRKRGAAFCSECWKEGYEHFIKDLKLSNYCPYHNRQYLTKCPHCRRNLHWHTPLDDQCRCKNKLSSPRCTYEEAENERKLLKIFRESADEDFRKLVAYLDGLGYRLESEAQCPANRCLMSSAFALLEDDMEGLLTNLRYLSSLYPDIPRRIIAAKLASFDGISVRNCAYEFIKHERVDKQRYAAESAEPVHPFSLTRSQISAWLKVPLHQWKNVTRNIDVYPENARYNWSQTQMMADEVLSIKHRNGFKKKKAPIDGMFKKDFQEKFKLSNGVLKSALAEHVLTKKWNFHRIFFDSRDIESFSKNFISLQFLSAKTQIPIKFICTAMTRLKIAPLNFHSSTLRRQLISIESSKLIIEWSNSNEQRPHKISARLSRKLARYIPTEAETCLPTALAARYLGIHVCVIRNLVKHGLLEIERRSGLGGCCHIDKKILDNFSENYIGVTETQSLLKCNYGMTTKTLRSVGIDPVTGPEVDRNPSAFFSRAKVSLYANTRDKLLREHSIGYTMLETCQKLQMSSATVKSLITAGYLHYADNTPQYYGLIKCIEIDTFHQHYASAKTIGHWLNISKVCVWRVLSQLSISPVNGTYPAVSIPRIYAIDDIAKYFAIPGRKKSDSHHGPGATLIRVADLWMKYDIRPITFGRLFLTSGFTTPIRIRYTTYLTHKDVAKVASILEKYCSPSQADRYLGASQSAWNLLKTNKLKTFFPLRGYSKSPMIKNAELQDYAVKHGFF